MKKVFLFIAICILATSSYSQVAIGEWRDHLPYNQGVAVEIVGDKVYMASNPGLHYYDKADLSINKVTKVEGLSDLNVKSIRYSEKYNTVVLGYENGNLDLIVGEQIINLSDIKRSTILGDKSINNIYINDDLAYLSCGFGIVVLDITKREIKETFKIGTNSTNVFVNEITFKEDTIFAATEEGIYFANSIGSNLADFQNWQVFTGLPSGNFNTIDNLNGLVITNFNKSGTNDQDTIYVYQNGSWEKPTIGSFYTNQHIFDINVIDDEILVAVKTEGWVLDPSFNQIFTMNTYWSDILPSWASKLKPMQIVADNHDYWVADTKMGLVNYPNGNSAGATFIPNGPRAVDAWHMDVSDNNLWVVSGGYNNAMNQTGNKQGTYALIDNVWRVHSGEIKGQLLDTIRDIIVVKIDPSNPKHVFIGSFGSGLVEFTNEQVTNIFEDHNSTLNKFNGFCAVSGLDFDNNGNLWALNTGLLVHSNPNPLHYYKDGTWMTFTIPEINDNSTILEKLMIDSHGNKWIIKSKSKFGIIVAKEQGELNTSTTFDVRHLSTTQGSGSLPSEHINDIEEDEKGDVWIATDQGIAVVFEPENIFDGSVETQQILIQKDGVWQNLLESEIVTSIAVDGGNKKWMGTWGAGVFLMSDDGTEELQHFDEENSPLLSNNIVDVIVDDVSGEVFFATDKGIISYKGDATGGGTTNDQVYAYPNPVRPEYTGLIGIKGLVDNAIVKITDLTGVVVHETSAEGGQATWDGKNGKGERANSGVYLVFISNDDGSETEVTKILLIN